MDLLEYGLKYKPPEPSISFIGPRLEDTMGKPEAILSKRMIGRFSQLDAKIAASNLL